MTTPTLFHIVSRGVDKRKIFMDGNDYQRFVHDLFEFNNQENTSNNSYRLQKLANFSAGQPIDIASRYIKPEPRKLLVYLHAFCLMNNHYHLLVSENIAGAIPLFMKKLNIGYVKYFNERHERIGTLFQGRYKSMPIKNEAHFIHIPYYIHCNPLDFHASGWRDREIPNYKNALKHLESYRWSSHLDYAGIKNFPSVTQREFLLKFFGGPQKYQESISEWLQQMNPEQINNIVPEQYY